MNIEDYDINKAYWCGDGVPTTLSPCELEKLSKDESILIGNQVRDALHESAALKAAVVTELPKMKEKCKECGQKECIDRIDRVLEVAGNGK